MRLFIDIYPLLQMYGNNKKNSFCYLRRANVLSELDNKEDNTKTHTQMSNAITLET